MPYLGEDEVHCFRKRDRSMYQRWNYANPIHYACDRAGVPRWVPNRLRHSAATEVRKSHGIEGAQNVLGHTQADITLVYAERDLKRACSIAAEIG